MSKKCSWRSRGYSESLLVNNRGKIIARTIMLIGGNWLASVGKFQLGEFIDRASAERACEEHLPASRALGEE